jgi:hypothetical protein
MTHLIKSLRSSTTGYVNTALVMAAFLLASQPAGASVFQFTLFPVNSLTAPGSTGELEVDLTNLGSTAVLIGGFRFGLTTNQPGVITFDSVTTNDPGIITFPGGPKPYFFSGSGSGSWHGPNIASTLNPTVAVMDQAGSNPMTLAAGATLGLGYVTYEVSSAATPGSVISIGFAPPPAYYGSGMSYCSSVFCEYLTASNSTSSINLNTMGIEIDAGDLVGGSITVASQDAPADVPEPEPGVLIPAGLFLVGLGALRKRRFQIGRRRRRIPGVRKSPMHEEAAPSQVGPCTLYLAT